MDKVSIYKVNESLMGFDSSEVSILREISDYFSYMAPGYQYSPKFRNHIWDGKIRLANLRNRTIPFGLAKSLETFCKERDYEFSDDTETRLKRIPDDLSSFDEWLASLKLVKTPRDYQIEAFKFAIEHNRGVLLSPTGCHAKGTKVWMADGSWKNVEDVKVGDRLIGHNGEIRTVVGLCSSEDDMYRITPKRKSESYVVNGEHILPLWDVYYKRMENVSVKDYLTKSNGFKHYHCLVSNDKEMDFGNAPRLEIDPYFMGVYLGDGHSRSCAVTTMEPDQTRCETKHIPEEYLTASIEDRYQLLAGLIDTDGFTDQRQPSHIEFCSKSEQLVTDVCRLAVSLGFNYSRKIKHIKYCDKDYYICRILGDCHKIPTRVPRRKAADVSSSRNVDIHHMHFDVEYLGKGTYYGFKLDGDHLYYTSNGVLQHNSGKSMCIYLLMRWMRMHDRRVMIIVPTTSLVEQMISDFKEYAENDDSFDVETEVNGLYGKRKCDPYESECTVATWQTLQKYPSELNETWDCVICDECHLAKAATISKIVGDAINAPFKFGFTGSLTGENVHEIMLTGLFGEVKRVITTAELQDAGNLAPLKIMMMILQYTKEESKALWKEHPKDFQAELDYIIHHPRRNMFIRNLALKCKGTVIVFFNLHEHGEELYRLISEAAGDDRQVFHIDGRVSTERREEIRQACLTNKNTIIVASVGTSSTGINIPSIQHVILYNSKSRVRNLQSIGRGLRLDKMKEGTVVWDLVDCLKTGNHSNYMMKHGLERYKLYQEEGFTVKTIPIKF